MIADVRKVTVNSVNIHSSVLRIWSSRLSVNMLCDLTHVFLLAKGQHDAETGAIEGLSHIMHNIHGLCEYILTCEDDANWLVQTLSRKTFC